MRKYKNLAHSQHPYAGFSLLDDLYNKNYASQLNSKFILAVQLMVISANIICYETECNLHIKTKYKFSRIFQLLIILV